jgi:hypothetical protein
MNIPVKALFCTTLLFSLWVKSAVGEPGNTAIQDSSSQKQKDIVDILEVNFKVHLRKDSTSIKGNGPFISVMPVVGYSLQSGLTGAIVSNTSFYTDESRTKFSSLLLNGYYSQFHQYWFTANSNLFFEKRKLHLFGDTRYYNFPTQTFGLGTNSSLNDALDIKYSYLRIYQIAFREIKPNIFIGVGYNLDYHWNIKPDSIQGKALDDLKKLQKDDRSASSGVSLDFLFDNRKNAVNPESGSYAFFQYRPNLTLLGSDNNWQSFVVDLRHYLKFPVSSRNVLAFWNYNNFTLNGTPPYLDTPSVGWDYYSNTGRGYVPGRYTGKNFMYLESEYRFVISRNGVLGGVVFGNAESIFQNWSDTHSIVPGGGLGLRLKINKYSNTNLAVDYGFGVGGSHGLFFNLGEVF